MSYGEQAELAKAKRAKSVARQAKRAAPATTPQVFVPATQESRFFTAEKRAAFLEAYSRGGSVQSAAAEAGVTGRCVFYVKARDEKFRAEFDAASEQNLDALEDLLRRHATERQGSAPGNLTAIFGVLNARRPAVWRQNHKIEHAGSVGVVTAEALKTAFGRLREVNSEVDSEAQVETAH